MLLHAILWDAVCCVHACTKQLFKVMCVAVSSDMPGSELCESVALNRGQGWADLQERLLWLPRSSHRASYLLSKRGSAVGHAASFENVHSIHMSRHAPAACGASLIETHASMLV